MILSVLNRLLVDLTCLNLACKPVRSATVSSHVSPLEQCTQSKEAEAAVKKKGDLPSGFYPYLDVLYICHTLRALLHLFLTHFGEESLHSSFRVQESRP
jgi:hypothetical protein